MFFYCAKYVFYSYSKFIIMLLNYFYFVFTIKNMQMDLCHSLHTMHKFNFVFICVCIHETPDCDQIICFSQYKFYIWWHTAVTLRDGKFSPPGIVVTVGWYSLLLSQSDVSHYFNFFLKTLALKLAYYQFYATRITSSTTRKIITSGSYIYN